jgi:hypothetical protein
MAEPRLLSNCFNSSSVSDLPFLQAGRTGSHLDCHFDAQSAAHVLGVVAIDRQRTRRVAWADDPAVAEAAAKRTAAAEQPTYPRYPYPGSQ